MDTYNEEVKKLDSINSEISKNNKNYNMYSSDKKDSILIKKAMAFALLSSSIFLDGVFAISLLSNPIIQNATLYVCSFIIAGLASSGLIATSILLDKNEIKNMEKKHNLEVKKLEDLRTESLNKIKSLEVTKSTTEVFEETNNDEKKVLENIKKEIAFLLNDNNGDDKNKIKIL